MPGETVSALSPGPKPPPPPPGGSVTSATQGLRPGPSNDVDATMSVARDIQQLCKEFDEHRGLSIKITKKIEIVAKAKLRVILMPMVYPSTSPGMWASSDFNLLPAATNAELIDPAKPQD